MAIRKRDEARFIFYDSIDLCAIAAAPLFQKQRWRWTNTGIPSQKQIYEALLMLQRTAKHETDTDGPVETGRLIYVQGKYGHEKPTRTAM